MDDTQAAWEGIAADVQQQTGCDDPPVDPFELAKCLGLDVRERPGSGGARIGDVIYVPAGARAVRRAGVCAHEIGHWCLDAYREENTEAGARYLAGALILPRRPFERDLGATAWNVRLLQQRHLHASAELIARRIVALRDAVATIFDNGRLAKRVISPWLPERFRRVSKWERELAACALETQTAQRGDDLVWAIPVTSDGWRRVVLIAEAEQLALRL